MNSKTSLVAAIVVVVAVVVIAAAVIIVSGDDDDSDDDSGSSSSSSSSSSSDDDSSSSSSGSSDDDSGTSDDDSGEYTVTVWFVDANENQESAEGTGDTLAELLESAASALGLVLAFDDDGEVRSVDGEAADDGYAWTIQKWASPTGWAVISPTISSLWDGMTLAVCYSEEGVDDSGDTTYSTPDIEVEYKVYFYFMILEEQNSTDWLADLPLTDDEKTEGLWLAGTGSTNNEALADAVISAFYPDSEVEVISGDTGTGTRSTYIEYIVDGETFFQYGTSSDMYGWFLEFLGWSDTERDGGAWTYWVQYSYNPDASTLDDAANWDYNSWSWGLYDISLYHYMSVVLRTTLVEDTYTEIPTPSTIPAGL